jgi:hypothetical protein
MPNDAEARCLQAIEEDCARILGAGIEIDRLEVAPDDRTATGVRLTLAYRLDGWTAETSVTGDTIVAAHATLRERPVVDRVRLAFSSMIEPGEPDAEPSTRSLNAAR